MASVWYLSSPIFRQSSIWMHLGLRTMLKGTSVVIFSFVTDQGWYTCCEQVRDLLLALGCLGWITGSCGLLTWQACRYQCGHLEMNVAFSWKLEIPKAPWGGCIAMYCKILQRHLKPRFAMLDAMSLFGQLRQALSTCVSGCMRNVRILHRPTRDLIEFMSSFEKQIRRSMPQEFIQIGDWSDEWIWLMYDCDRDMVHFNMLQSILLCY